MKNKVRLGNLVEFNIGDEHIVGTVVIIDPKDNDGNQYCDIIQENSQILLKHVNIKSLTKVKIIYISLPISLDPTTVDVRYADAVNYVNENFRGYRISGPINIEDFSNKNHTMYKKHDYAWYMGEDIKILLRSDAILMCGGWEYSNGCKAEHSLAKIYGIEIHYMNAESSTSE